MGRRNRKNYIAYADIARIAAAFSVVMLHVSGARLIREPVGSFNFFWAAFFDCGTRWTVPLFIMLSGMLFLDKKKQLDVKKLYTKNMLRLVTAFLFWSFLYNLYSEYTVCKSIIKALAGAVKNTHNGAMHLWFVFIIVGLYIVLPFVKRMCESMTKKEAEGFILLSMAVTFLPKTLSSFEIFEPFIAYIGKFEINYAAGYVGLFVAGWYIASFEHTKDFRTFVYLGGAASFLYMLICTLCFSYAKEGLCDEFMSFKSITAFIMAFAVLLFIKSAFGKRTFKRRTNSNIAFYARYTFGVYLVHELFLNISSAKGWFVLASMPYIGIPLETCIVFCLSIIVTGLISALPFGKYIS